MAFNVASNVAAHAVYGTKVANNAAQAGEKMVTDAARQAGKTVLQTAVSHITEENTRATLKGAAKP